MPIGILWAVLFFWYWQVFSYNSSCGTLFKVCVVESMDFVYGSFLVLVTNFKPWLKAFKLHDSAKEVINKIQVTNLPPSTVGAKIV